MLNELNKALGSKVLLMLICFAIFLSLALGISFDAYYHEKDKNVLVAIEYAGYIFGFILLTAVAISSMPLIQWLFLKKIKKTYVNDATTAKNVGILLKKVLIIEIIIGICIGLFTPEFRDLIGWLIEQGKTIVESVKSYVTKT